jgi:hypothetical protein
MKNWDESLTNTLDQEDRILGFKDKMMNYNIQKKIKEK